MTPPAPAMSSERNSNAEKAFEAKGGLEIANEEIPPAGFGPATLGLGNRRDQDATPCYQTSCDAGLPSLAVPLPSQTDADPLLARLLATWSDLPDAMRQTIAQVLDIDERLRDLGRQG